MAAQSTRKAPKVVRNRSLFTKFGRIHFIPKSNTQSIRSERGEGPTPSVLVKRSMSRKRYALVFAIGLIVANGYTFWPLFAYPGLTSCPAIFGFLDFEVGGAAQVVGAPLYSQMQLVIHPGSMAYERAVYRSEINNLTQLFQNYPPPGSNPVTQDLYRIDGFSGSENDVSANQTGVTITFENITFESIHVAKILYNIEVSNSANYASYEIGRAPCWTGLVLTVGYQPYAGPLPYGQIQLIAIIINNVVAIIGSTMACIALRFYWTLSRGRFKQHIPSP